MEREELEWKPYVWNPGDKALARKVNGAGMSILARRLIAREQRRSSNWEFRKWLLKLKR